MEKEELEKILKMVSDGSMKPEDAARLIQAIENRSAEEVAEKAPPKGSAKWVKIRVTDLNTGKAKVYLRIPIWLVRGALKLGGKSLKLSFLDSSTVAGGDLTEKLNELIASGESGKLLDVTDEDERERVEIVVE